MANLITVDELLARNSAQAETHQRIPTFKEILGAGKRLPNILIVTCADPRCIPENYFKLNTGEAVVLRTAGANVPSVLPSILSIDSLVKFTDIMVVKHTDCGATMYRDAKIKEELVGLAPGSKADVEGIKFGEITGTLEESARQEVAFLLNSDLIRPELKANISGYVYDLETGNLKKATTARL